MQLHIGINTPHKLHQLRWIECSHLHVRLILHSSQLHKPQKHLRILAAAKRHMKTFLGISQRDTLHFLNQSD